MTKQLTIKDITAAQARIAPHLLVTPISASHAFSTENRKVYLKWDNQHITGSFKERGARNFLECLTEEERSQGVVAASAGNHALALSYHASQLNINCSIIMPIHAPFVKVQRTKSYGAVVQQEGKTFDEAVSFATEKVNKEGGILVPAYNHRNIIAGQGVCGLEMLEQLPELDSIVVPIGGGGLISGIALAVKEKKPDVHVIGVQSAWAHDAREKGFAGGQLSSLSIADGIAVKTIGTETAPLIDRYVDEIVTVTEGEIATAVMRLLEEQHTVVEGAGAAGLAGYFQIVESKLPRRCKHTVIEICGSNIDLNLLSRLIERRQSQLDRLLDLKASVPDRPGSLEVLVKHVAEQGGNVLRVLHDRSYSAVPGNVDIEMVIEVAGPIHRKKIVQALEAQHILLTVRDNIACK